MFQTTNQMYVCMCMYLLYVYSYCGEVLSNIESKQTKKQTQSIEFYTPETRKIIII